MADLGGDAQDDFPEFFQKEWAKAGITKKAQLTAEAPCQPSQTLYRKLSIDSKNCARDAAPLPESLYRQMNSQSTNTYLPPLLREALVKDGREYRADLSSPFFTEMESKHKEEFAVAQEKGKPRAYYAAKFVNAGGGAPPTNTKQNRRAHVCTSIEILKEVRRASPTNTKQNSRAHFCTSIEILKEV